MPRSPPVAAPQPVVPFPGDMVSSQRYDFESETQRSASSRKRRRSDVSMSSTTARQYHQPLYAQIEPPPPPVHFDDQPSTSPGLRSRQPSGTSSTRTQPHYREVPPRQVDPVEYQESPESQDPSRPSSAGGSPRERATSLSDDSPISHAGPVPSVSPPPAAPPPASHWEPSPSFRQLRTTSHQSDPNSTSSSSLATPREKPLKKKTKQAHNGRHNDTDTIGRDSSGQFGEASSSNQNSSRPGGAGGFANYLSPATFSIPTASSSSPGDAEENSKRKSAHNQRASAPIPTPGVQQYTELDNAVATHLRSLFKADVAWSEFTESRKNLLTMSQQMKHLKYAQSKFDKYIGLPVPETIEGGHGETITKVNL